MVANILKRIKNQLTKTKGLLIKTKDIFVKRKSSLSNQPENDSISEIPTSIYEEYAAIISPHIAYYRDLVEEEKEIFIKRVYFFQRGKKFHFLDLEEKPEMPVLISSVAVEITFGLDNYLLPFFKNIYLISDVYQVMGNEEWYLGHVAPSGIYISWKHFLQGFENSEDNFNTGLHELAHAVHHENFVDEKGIDWEFRDDLEKLSQVFGPMVTQSLIQNKSYLRGYAFVNFYEFWAVSLEAFFENPSGLKNNLPNLYNTLCQTLRQDPLAKYKRLMTSR